MPINREIIAEFRNSLTQEPMVNSSTQAIVVLSIRPPHYAENTERIRYGWEIAQQVASIRAEKPAIDLQWLDTHQHAPTLILNTETECLDENLDTALSLGVPKEKILLLDSGSLAVCNTKTNMEAMADHPQLSQLQHVTIVTSGYHIPRTTRTAKQYLPESLAFDVLAVPHGRFDFDVIQKVRGEIRRMREYVKSGDIVAHLR